MVLSFMWLDNDLKNLSDGDILMQSFKHSVRDFSFFPWGPTISSN